MNKFIHDPDNLASLAGCAFWLVALAGMMGVFLATLAGILGGGAR